jgi:hypothetical protein
MVVSNGNSTGVNMYTYVLDEHEALGVGDNLGGVEGLLKIVDESLLVALELGGRTTENGAGAATLFLQGAEAAREDSLTNQGDGHAEVKSVDGSPLSGTLLASLVEDLVNKGSAIVIVVVENITGDLNKEGVENTSVPLGENITNLLVGETKTTLKDIIGLTDQLHVTILNTVVDHLDVVTGTLVTDPVAAGLTVALGGNALEDVLDVGPGGLVTTGHEGGTVTGTLLTTGDTGSNEADALLGEVASATVAVRVVGVTTVNDDITLLKERQEGLNEVIDGLSGHDEEHDATGTLELGAELLDGVSTDDGLA